MSHPLLITRSLGSRSEWSAHLKVVVDFSGLVRCVKVHVVSGTSITSNLDVHFAQVVNGEGLSLSLIQSCLSSINCSLELISLSLCTLSRCLIMEILNERVVGIVGSDLKWVLVIGEESVVSVGEVSHGS